MSNQDISCGIEFMNTFDLQSCLSEALHSNYSFTVSPIVHPRFRRHYVSGTGCVGGFTRSDMVLSPQDWTSRMVVKVSPYLNVDCASPIVRIRHEDCLNEELSYCRGVGVPVIMLTLHGKDSTNLARLLHTFHASSHHPTIIWTRVPMVCNRTLREISDEADDKAWNEPWHWWSKFHELMEWDKRIGVVLELTADLPSDEILQRWLGEPIKAFAIPTSVFLFNKKGYPVLSKAHQHFVQNLLERDAQVIITGARRSNIDFYYQYLHRLWRKPAPNQPNPVEDPMLCYAKGWEDYLQTPLQPLADNLDSNTYNVFEKDPVKYDQYQKAITKALLDLQRKRASCKDSDKDETNEIKEVTNTTNEAAIGDNVDQKAEVPITVMVLGAGRGPLVRATLNAADITNSKVKVIAVEKNPCAVVVLAAQVREVWRDRDVTLVPGDMRQLHLSPKADIIVSELLGSWGDNELSPECLDGAAGLLKPDGISIPCEYRSYLAPISSSRLWGAAIVASSATINATNQKEKNLETLWVVYMQSKHGIAETKLAFTFNHPAKAEKDHEGQDLVDYRGLPLTDNRRSTTITWKVEQDNVMHGFGGYFDCTLFGEEMISIVPSTHSIGMISWFPVFIPIKTPLRVKKGDIIKATFWRCVTSRRVWYEWIVEVGDRTTTLHNPMGRSSEMLL